MSAFVYVCMQHLRGGVFSHKHTHRRSYTKAMTPVVQSAIHHRPQHSSNSSLRFELIVVHWTSCCLPVGIHRRSQKITTLKRKANRCSKRLVRQSPGRSLPPQLMSSQTTRWLHEMIGLWFAFIKEERVRLRFRTGWCVRYNPQWLIKCFGYYIMAMTERGVEGLGVILLFTQLQWYISVACVCCCECVCECVCVCVVAERLFPPYYACIHKCK